MSAKLTLSWEQARQIVENSVFAHFGEPLKEIQLYLLQDVWEGLTYSQIAQKRYLSVNYLRGDIGPKLWQKLSLALGQEVTKSNFKNIIEQSNPVQTTIAQVADHRLIERETFAFPEGSVAPDSLFYQERSTDALCYQTLHQGGFLQVRSPQTMGKTSLLKRMLYRVSLQGYQTLYLEFFSLEPTWLTDWELFLRWFCLSLGRQLQGEEQLPCVWDTTIMSATENCTYYLETFILPSLDNPLILAFDDGDRLFSYPEITEKFLRMLRNWNEKTKSSPLWQKLRLMVAYSTSDRHFNQIPSQLFNFGILVELDDFQKPQIQQLMTLYNLQLSELQLEMIIDLMGGHPYLIRLFFYHLTITHLSLEVLLEEATTQAGIYSNFLYQMGEVLQSLPDIARAFKMLLKANQAIALTPTLTYALYYLGLVKKQGNKANIRYDLYRQYFKFENHLNG